MSEMQPTPKASSTQITILQTLYSQLCVRTLTVSKNTREERLRWASEGLGRQICTFKELSRDEARKLIDMLRAAPGAIYKRRKIQRRSRELAHAAGTSGRRGANGVSIEYMASPDDLLRIENAIERLGWTREQYEQWLRSLRSPLGRHANPQVRTMSDANRVWWALKAMLRQSGKWVDKEKSFDRSEQVSSNGM